MEDTHKQDGLQVWAALCFMGMMLLFEFIDCKEQKPTEKHLKQRLQPDGKGAL